MAVSEEQTSDAVEGATNGSTAGKDATPREVRKRQRQWLSCEACHKMKVKWCGLNQVYVD